MIIKDLLERCPEEQIVSAVLDLSSVDQAERNSVAQSYRAFLERLRQIQPLIYRPTAFFRPLCILSHRQVPF